MRVESTELIELFPTIPLFTIPLFTIPLFTIQLFTIQLFLLLQQPKSEKHQENQHTCCSKKKSGQKLLNWCEQAHAYCNNEIDDVEEDQIMNSFIHGCCFFLWQISE